jgi:putative ABC transport system permease protein
VKQIVLDSVSSLAPYWMALGIVFIYFKGRQKKLAHEIIWASFRTTIQLFLLALALEEIFHSPLVLVSLGVSLFMALNSSGQVMLRSRKRGLRFFWIIFSSNVFAIWPLALALSYDLSDSEWLLPKKLLPLMGMLLGNTLSGISIGVENFLQSFSEKRNEVLSSLSLGATIPEATQRIFYRALRASITPQINSMISMGIVSIPGMMAGQLISAVDPLVASVLQIKMMIVICLGTFLASYLAIFFIRKGQFMPSGELCLK